MLDLLLKPEATSDLKRIFEFTFKTWGIQQAEEYQDDLFGGMQLLVSRETLSKEYLFAQRPYRKSHVNRHLIFYRIEKGRLVIVRILHDHVDISRHL